MVFEGQIRIEKRRRLAEARGQGLLNLARRGNLFLETDDPMKFHPSIVIAARPKSTALFALLIRFIDPLVRVETSSDSNTRFSNVTTIYIKAQISQKMLSLRCPRVPIRKYHKDSSSVFIVFAQAALSSKVHSCLTKSGYGNTRYVDRGLADFRTSKHAIQSSRIQMTGN